MNFVSANCPHCGKELQIPDDTESIVCMYCAQPIDVKTLLAKPAKVPGENYQRLMHEAESLLCDEIFKTRIQMKNIKLNTYSGDFESYAALFSPALKSFCLAATENDKAADYFAGVLFNRFLKQFESEGIKKESDPRFFDCRYMIVSFTVPAILQQNTPAADALADCFLAKWNEHFPKYRLGKSRFEEINSGFRKKLCFITTAVCSSLGKDDNCKELNTFRQFRDEWLCRTTLGKAKINEYYLFAPMIVSAIDQAEESETVYREIWENHLSPCLAMIESGDPQKCAEQYERMVVELETKWLN
jgi:hypothetical protein